MKIHCVNILLTTSNKIKDGGDIKFGSRIYLPDDGMGELTASAMDCNSVGSNKLSEFVFWVCIEMGHYEDIY